MKIRDLPIPPPMLDSLKWTPPDTVRTIAAKGTDAIRLAGAAGCTIEVFGPACLISSTAEPRDVGALLDRIGDHSHACGLAVPEHVFFRKLAIGPGPDNVPARLRGAGSSEFEARENGLAFGVDFSAGYSCGLFIDQRDNRSRLREITPSRVLNCFAFTCAFTVAAAACGAESVSIDLSKRSLAKGKENLARNSLPAENHRFIADDVFDVLPRLARRGERFDAIILDPPTFARGNRGRVFRAEDGFPDLLRLAAACAAPQAHMLISTNCSKLRVSGLTMEAKTALPGAAILAPSPPPDCAAGMAASSIWASNFA